MIKAGILSMQRIANYGSFLQAYGLRKILEELDCCVEFVDYHPGQTLIAADGGHGIVRKVSKVVETFRYRAPLKEKIKFIKYKKNYASNYYPYLGISSALNYTPEVDLLVIGSDEVFNCVQSNTNVGFSPELFGEGHKAKRLITYAASFGNTTLEKLNQHHVAEQVSEWLKKFDAISVRDINSGRIIEALTENTPSYNLDPVLAYDFMGSCKEIPETVSEKDYMILYGYSGRFTKEECRSIRKYADQNNLAVFCIGGVQDCCDKFIDCDPFSVIAYFKNAACVVTDTFHGTILSVITHQQFVSVIRSAGYGNAEKMNDLLTRLRLTNRSIADLSELEGMLNEKIDYTTTDQIIQQERANTRAYLVEQISSKG